MQLIHQLRVTLFHTHLLPKLNVCSLPHPHSLPQLFFFFSTTDQLEKSNGEQQCDQSLAGAGPFQGKLIVSKSPTESSLQSG